jgi:hypothetical protein
MCCSAERVSLTLTGERRGARKNPADATDKQTNKQINNERTYERASKCLAKEISRKGFGPSENQYFLARHARAMHLRFKRRRFGGVAHARDNPGVHWRSPAPSATSARLG